jgi:hypothetical protein
VCSGIRERKASSFFQPVSAGHLAPQVPPRPPNGAFRFWQWGVVRLGAFQVGPYFRLWVGWQPVLIFVWVVWQAHIKWNTRTHTEPSRGLSLCLLCLTSDLLPLTLQFPRGPRLGAAPLPPCVALTMADDVVATSPCLVPSPHAQLGIERDRESSTEWRPFSRLVWRGVACPCSRMRQQSVVCPGRLRLEVVALLILGLQSLFTDSQTDRGAIHRWKILVGVWTW